MTYLVMAHRWGNTNGHWYLVYCGPDKTKAEAIAVAEAADRGGKYGCAVYEFDADGTEYKRIAYSGSGWGDDAPFHNHRLDMFQSLGHKFASFARGFETRAVPDHELKRADGGPLMVVKEFPCAPPRWVKDEYERAMKLCEALMKLEVERNG